MVSPQPLILSLALLAPMTAQAEGAVLTFDCTATITCRQDGQCSHDTTAVTFVIRPVSADADGAGDYMINHGTDEFEMQNVTGFGPLVWSEGGDNAQVLLLTSATTLLWQQFDAINATSTMTFLTCEITQ